MDHSVLAVTVADPYARAFYDAPDMKDYYECIDVLRPFLGSNEWTSAVTGFYLFRHRPARHQPARPPSLRLTYFVSTIEEYNIAHDLIRGVPLNRVHEANPSREKLLNPSAKDQDELRFRRFLCGSTCIGLELMDVDLQNARTLYNHFRANQTYGWGDLKDKFLSAVEAQSGFYRSLSADEKAEFITGTESACKWSHNFVGVVVDDCM